MAVTAAKLRLLPEPTAWRDAISAVSDIATLAAGAEAEVVIVVMPNTGLLYRDHIAGLEKYKAILNIRYEGMMTSFKRKFSGAANVRVIDPTAVLASALGREDILASQLDFHLNNRGIDVLFRHLTEALEPSARAQTGRI